MPSQVQYLSQDIYRRLLILDPPPVKRKVSFSDLNEIKYYNQEDEPAKISKKGEIEVLRERVKNLERRLEKLSPKPQPNIEPKEKENMPRCLHIPAELAREINLPPVPPLSRTPATPGSAHSVTSPYRPVSDSRTAQSNATRPRATGTDTTASPPPMPAHLHRAIRAASTTPTTPANTRAPVQRPVLHQPQPAQPVPSKAKRFVLALGALAAVAFIPSLIAGLVVLGPAGLGVAAGVAALSAGLMYLGHKMS